ncbi:class F sortase [Saccharothrix yanglingensis]|uniref:Class F sortase n=1 Tax=Saccharothrix yanglingensis TaxID=659496 RepID=A0ABU0X4W9_9PSEU|nr:class F sortase [Saccharothrix yanglingensis]MDQ2586652.1 class F sortase [Saccharothrix yanglingensis]
MTTRTRAIIAATAAALLIAGLSTARLLWSPGDDGPTGHTVGQPAAASPPAVSDAVPVEVRIPALGARSSLVPLGLDADGTAEVPPLDRPLQAGWYKHGPAPGDTGPAVLLGHVDGRGEPGIFHDLAKLVPGDRVEVVRHDRTTATFTVRRVDRVPKDRFPTDTVYGETATPQLRLITCGGAFDPSSGDYRDNVIAYADLV